MRERNSLKEIQDVFRGFGQFEMEWAINKRIELYVTISFCCVIFGQIDTTDQAKGQRPLIIIYSIIEY